jgi:hypothetical protein
MELLADRNPEEARKILDPVFEQMMEAVHCYEGTVNQVMGDGIMALFGAPVAHEDHAVRACYAALRMLDSVRRYSDQLRCAQGVEVQIRVGINSGGVVVRSIGSDLSAWITSRSGKQRISLFDEAFRERERRRRERDRVRRCQLFHPRGETAWADSGQGPRGVGGVYEVIGAGTARMRLQAAARRGLTRFVGRDAEVEHLRRVLGRAGAGHGQVVALVGEAGVGKSRLTHEFAHSPRVQDWLVLGASSVSYGKATSYSPVIDLLRGYFKIGD